MIADAAVRRAEAVPGGRLPRLVVRVAGRVQGGVRDAEPVGGVPAQVEVAAQRVGEQPCRASGPVLGGFADGEDQVVAFRFEPGQGVLRCGTGGGAGQAQHVRVERVGGGPGPVEVSVEQALHRGVPLVGGFLGGGAFGGVQAQQVVSGVPAGNVFVDQVRAGEPGEQGGGGVPVDVAEHGRVIRGAVGAGGQAEAAEQPAGVRVQAGVGDREGGPHGVLRVAVDGEGAEAVVAAELGDVRGDRPGRAGHQVGRGDAQGQRQVRAEPAERGGLLRFGGDPAGAEDPGEQRVGLVRAEHAEP